jgi:hypothetical protein
MAEKLCEHEDALLAAGWTPEVKIVIWTHPQNDGVSEVHYEGPALTVGQKEALLTYVQNLAVEASERN